MNAKCSEVVENEIRKDITDSECVGIGKAEDQVSGKQTRSIACSGAGSGSLKTNFPPKFVPAHLGTDMVKNVDSGNLTANAACNEIQQEQKERERRHPIQAAVSRYEEEAPIRIVCADFFSWCLKNLQENSINFILTDPPYPRKFLHVWGQLGEVALRVLKPGGYLATYSGQYYSPTSCEPLSSTFPIAGR